MGMKLATLFLGFVAGWLGQRSRMCFIGGYRDYFLVGDKSLIKGTLAFFLSAWLTLSAAKAFFPVEVVLNSYPTFQDLEENSYSWLTLWLTLGLGAALGFFTTLSDACPLRHHVLAGQGRVDSIIFIAGLVIGIIIYYAVVPFIIIA